MKKEKKITRIEVENRFGRHYSWSASMLLWDELPKSLLRDIEMELPNYQVTNIEYKQ